MTALYVQCRYLRHNDEMCTGEAVDPLGEILICSKHLARAVELLRARGVRVEVPQPGCDHPACQPGGDLYGLPHR